MTVREVLHYVREALLSGMKLNGPYPLSNKRPIAEDDIVCSWSEFSFPLASRVSDGFKNELLICNEGYVGRRGKRFSFWC